MKRILALGFGLLLFVTGAVAQNTATVSATVVDSDNTTWINGTWKLAFTPNRDRPNINIYRIGDSPLDPSIIYQSGSINGSGYLSFTAYRNTVITPVGSSWTLTVCPNASAPCGVYNFSIPNVSSIDISSQLTSVIPAPRFIAISGTYGYSDVEASLQLTQGSTYYNTTQNCQKAYSGTSWNCTNNVNGTPITPSSVNGIWDLKAKFGAVGSDETISCTATANSYVLAGCGTGDFVAGEYVFIPYAGNSPTISTPSAPTAACASDNGGSCTGSTQYCYEIVAAQTGYYSRPLTAPSPATCLGQATQTAQSAYHSTAPDVYTALSWTCPASSDGCVIYKSINGSAYNFYEYYPGAGAQSTKDFNHAPSAQFTISELGFPAIAPSSTTPSGVFSQIQSVNGSTITLEARSFDQPNRSDPSEPGASVGVTVYHDDTPSFYSAWQALYANTGNGLIQLHVPAGNYPVYGYNQPPGTGTQPATLLLFGLSNFVLNGDGIGVSNIIQDFTQDSSNFIFGQCGWSNTVACTQITIGGQGRGFNLNDPSIVGNNSITLSAPSDSSHFTVGGYITIFDNTSTYPYEYYSEVNKVLAIDSTTGILTLAYPLSKTYSATLPSPYSTCSLCNGAPMAYPVIGGLVASNITFQNFSFRGPILFANVNTIDGLTFRNMQITAQAFLLNGQMRNQTEINDTILEDPWSPQQTWGLVQAAAGSNDILASNNTYTNDRAGATFGQQFCSEGSANVTDTDNTYTLSNSSDASTTIDNPFSPANMGWNCSMQGDRVSFFNTNFTGIFGGDDGNGGQGIIKGTKFYIDSVSSSTQASVGSAWAFGRNFSSPYVVVANDNKWITPSTNSLGQTSVNDSSYQPTVEEQTFSSVSGNITAISSNYGNAKIFILNLAAAYINKIDLGSSRIAGYSFSIVFVQPSSGSVGYLQSGPTCASSLWNVTLDCTNQQPPNISQVNSAVTIMNFWDDGTTVHFLGSNNGVSLYMTNYADTASGNYNVSKWCQASSYTLTMTGNVNQVVIGGGDSKGCIASISFVQPASGGPYTLPSSCASWTLGNGEPTFISSICPAANPAANSVTTVWFWDDGSTVHEISRSYWAPGTGFSTPTAVSWTPSAATASACVAQAVTVTGLVTGARLVVNPPTGLGTHIWIGSTFVSAANTASVAFCADATGGTPPSGTWIFSQ